MKKKRQNPSETPAPAPAKDDEPTKIALPFADTPIIKRNKEMRKASADSNRRSSSGMRGRRASSLIDEGRGNGELACLQIWHCGEQDMLYVFRDLVREIPD